MKNKILIVGGEPNSINTEILFKCWKNLNSNLKNKIYLIANFKLIKEQLKKLNLKLKIKRIENFQETHNNSLKIINVNLNFKNPFDVSLNNSTNYVKKCLDLAHSLAIKNKIKGIINCPIDKRIFKLKKIGVTEYLAKKCNLKKDTEVMLIANEYFSVSPITTHIDLKQVSKKINKEKIIKKVITINSWFIKYKKFRPKIGILGLNPHNAEMRNYSEEIKHIVPAIKHLKRLKVSVKGPLVTDTIFMKDYKNFDVLIGMYHDQVLSPFKALYGFNALNITLGLKYHRLSPDHGIANNLIKKNKANELSLFKCINFLNNLKK